MKYLVVASPRDCPNCKAKAGTESCDYDCPECGKSFCSHCYKTDPSGPGTYVFCPGCGMKLFFPTAQHLHQTTIAD